MRILITGATGFLGRHLCVRLADDHEIIALVRRSPSTPVPNVQYRHQDLAAPLDVRQLPGAIDAVVHQAALIETDAVQDEALPFLINVVATWRLLTYAKNVGARIFLHASTGGVYGCRDRAFVEGDPANPMDLYSLTKSQAELAVRHAEGTFAKVILRYFFPYGPGTPNPIPRYIRAGLVGEPVEITASRKPRFNPIHITDAVEATVRALALADDDVINVAGAETTTFAAIVEHAAQQAGREPNFVTVSDMSVMPYYRADLVAGTSHMQRTLRYIPQVNLRTGLTELTAHLMAHK